jgi:acyl-CoA synthetase (AMP-forming)/AMP-acid ligase II
MLKAVPPIVLFLAKSPIVEKYDLSSLLVISSGAAPLGSEICEEVKKRLPNVRYIIQGFGMSETSVASHMPYLSSNMTSCGKLMPNMVCVENEILFF